MSRLIQIESDVAELPAQDQWTLLSWLQVRLTSQPNPTSPDTNKRREWLNELSELRAKTHTGTRGMPLQQLVDELREDRC